MEELLNTIRCLNPPPIELCEKEKKMKKFILSHSLIEVQVYIVLSQMQCRDADCVNKLFGIKLCKQFSKSQP